MSPVFKKPEWTVCHCQLPRTVITGHIYISVYIKVIILFLKKSTWTSISFWNVSALLHQLLPRPPRSDLYPGFGGVAVGGGMYWRGGRSQPSPAGGRGRRTAVDGGSDPWFQSLYGWAVPGRTACALCPMQAREVLHSVSPRGLQRRREGNHQIGSFWLSNCPCKTAPMWALSFINEIFVSSHLNLKNPFKMRTSLKSKYVELFLSMCFQWGTEFAL